MKTTLTRIGLASFIIIVSGMALRAEPVYSGIGRSGPPPAGMPFGAVNPAAFSNAGPGGVRPLSGSVNANQFNVRPPFGQGNSATAAAAANFNAFGRGPSTPPNQVAFGASRNPAMQNGPMGNGSVAMGNNALNENPVTEPRIEGLESPQARVNTGWILRGEGLGRPDILPQVEFAGLRIAAQVVERQNNLLRIKAPPLMIDEPIRGQLRLLTGDGMASEAMAVELAPPQAPPAGSRNQ